jgi:hypothetical protein
MVMVQFSGFCLRVFAAVALLGSLAGVATAQPASGTSSSLAFLREGSEILTRLSDAARAPCVDPQAADALTRSAQAWRAKASTQRVTARTVNEIYDEMLGVIQLLRRKPPCPPGERAAALFIGAHGIIGSSTMKVDERSAATGVTTFQSSDSRTAGGGGVNFGYEYTLRDFAYRDIPIQVTPHIHYLVGFDFPGFDIKHSFPNGTFYSQRTNFIGTAAIGLGVELPQGIKLALRAGGSLAHQETKIDFGGPVTTQTILNPGIMGGAVLSYRPYNRLGGNQGTFLNPELFVAYERHMFRDTVINQPAASPGFNYRFDNTQDMVKAGVKLDFVPDYRRPFGILNIPEPPPRTTRSGSGSNVFFGPSLPAARPFSPGTTPGR